MLPFNTAWDEACFHQGPASLFTMDHKGWFKVDPERTREIWLLLGPLERQEPTHWGLTDAKTGLRLYLCATHPELALRQARGEVQRFESGEEALAWVGESWKIQEKPEED